MRLFTFITAGVLVGCAPGIIGEGPPEPDVLAGPMQVRLDESLAALEVIDHASRGQEGPPWPTARICQLGENGGEELERDVELLELFPPPAQEGIVRRFTFARNEMQGWDEPVIPEEPDPLETDADVGFDVREKLSDIQDENATLIAGLAEAEKEIPFETAICLVELAHSATPSVANDMVGRYSPEALPCAIRCLHEANTAAAEVCLTEPTRFVSTITETGRAIAQYLTDSCPAVSPGESCPLE